MSWRLRWLIIAPVVLFVAGTLLMSSCGGGSSGCFGTYDAFGNFISGVCPSPGPQAGFNLEMIVIGAGPPVTATPSPAVTPTGHPKLTPTATPTLEPQAGPTAAVVGQPQGVPFHASGLFVKGSK